MDEWRDSIQQSTGWLATVIVRSSTDWPETTNVMFSMYDDWAGLLGEVSLEY